jgi:hypothetical protein
MISIIQAAFVRGSQLLSEPEQKVDARDSTEGHENHQPPGYVPACTAIEKRVEKGASQESNRKEIEHKLHGPTTLEKL